MSVSLITIELVPLLPVLVWLLVDLLVEVMEGAETFLLELEPEYLFLGCNLGGSPIPSR